MRKLAVCLAALSVLPAAAVCLSLGALCQPVGARHVPPPRRPSGAARLRFQRPSGAPRAETSEVGQHGADRA